MKNLNGPWVLLAVALLVLYLITRPHLVTTYKVVDDSGTFYSSESSLMDCEATAQNNNKNYDPSLLANPSPQPSASADPFAAYQKSSKHYRCESHVSLVWGW